MTPLADVAWYTGLLCATVLYGAWVNGGTGIGLGLAFLSCLLVIDSYRSPKRTLP